MKRTCRASALLSAVTLFLPAVLLTAAVAPARADVSVSATAGNDNFLYNDLNFDVNVSSALDAGAYVARYSGNFVSRTELYAATLSWQERSAYASVSGYYSPETDDYLFYGGQVTGGFQGGTRDLPNCKSGWAGIATHCPIQAIWRCGSGSRRTHQSACWTPIKRCTVSIRRTWPSGI
jgi:hypothetical protein